MTLWNRFWEYDGDYNVIVFDSQSMKLLQGETFGGDVTTFYDEMMPFDFDDFDEREVLDEMYFHKEKLLLFII